MAHLQTTLLLNASVERVWTAYTDVTEVGAWLPGAGSGICASRPLSREGTRYRLRFSRWQRLSVQVVAVDPYRLHQRRFRDVASHLRGTVTTQFSAIGDATCLTFDFNYTFAPLWLDAFLDRLLGGGIRRQAEDELASFQHYIEGMMQAEKSHEPRQRKTVTLTAAVIPV